MECNGLPEGVDVVETPSEVMANALHVGRRGVRVVDRGRCLRGENCFLVGNERREL